VLQRFLSSSRGWTFSISDEQIWESFFLPVEVKESLEVIPSHNEAGRSPVKLLELEVSTSVCVYRPPLV